MAPTIYNGMDILDSRDVITLLAELESDYDDATTDEDRDLLIDDLDALRGFARDGADYVPDWAEGEGLIADSHFRDYAEDLAADIGAIPTDVGWPCSYIDWDLAAAALKEDYQELEWDGVTYWARQ